MYEERLDLEDKGLCGEYAFDNRPILMVDSYGILEPKGSNTRDLIQYMERYMERSTTKGLFQVSNKLKLLLFELVSNMDSL